MNIDYALLAKAIAYYTSIGYEYIEVPWIVDEETQLITCPSSDMIYKTTGGGLVGSAEQSFIKLQLDGKLKPNSLYCTVTPCFRLGDGNTSPLHQEYFIKLELFSNCYYTMYPDSVFEDIRHDAYRFFMKISRNYPIITGDIELNGIEIGSYGRRTLPSGDVVSYGTGLALPRFSQANDKYL